VGLAYSPAAAAASAALIPPPGYITKPIDVRSFAAEVARYLAP